MKSLRQVLRDYLVRRAFVGGYSWDVDKYSLILEVITYSLIPVPVITYLITKSLPLSLMLAPTPALPILLVVIWSTYSVDSVKEGVEWELPFFVVLLDIVHDVGGDITHAFELSGKVGLRWIGREWSIIRRYSLTTNSITKAMQVRARLHPSLEFQRFVNGYVSVWSYSGDVGGYVRSVEGTYLSTLSSRLSSLSRQIIDVVVATVSSLVVLILFVIVTTVLGMNYAILYIVPAVALLLPALIARVYQSIPYIIRMDVIRDKSVYMALGASVMVAAILILYLGVKGVMALMLPPLLFSAMVTRRVNAMRDSIMALPDLMRDISEIVKAGVGIGAAIERILDNPYPPPLIAYLRGINQLSGNAEVNGPWIMRFAMGVLRELSSLGSPSRALDRLVEVFLELKTIMMGINYGSRSLQLLNYSLPAVFAGITYISRFVVQTISSIIENAPYALIGLSIPGINAVLMPLLLTAYIVSLSVALLSSLLGNLSINPTIKYVIPIPLTLALMLITVEIPVLA